MPNTKPRTACVTVLPGDCRKILQALPDKSVHCVITSPPYWSLRDYGHPDQIGIEPQFEDYLEKIVGVFREVHRVLLDDGTLWLNLGDSYVGGGRGPGKEGTKQATVRGTAPKNAGQRIGHRSSFRRDRAPLLNVPHKAVSGLCPKQLIGQPWRVAFALQADGWIMRQDIIWSKPQPMPESVTDRCTKSHEYLFLLSKSARYHFDNEAIKEPVARTSHPRGSGRNPKCAGWADGPGSHHAIDHSKPGGKYKGSVPGRNGGPGQERRSKNPRQNESWSEAVTDLVENRNKRSVWTVPTASFSGAHFATFPPDLIKPCILAGCPTGGMVLDPFAGSGTTGMVALELGRSAILIELSPDYLPLIAKRIDVTPGLPL